MRHLLGKFRKFPGGGPQTPPMGGTNLLMGKRPQAQVAHSRAEVPSIVAWPLLLRFCGSAPDNIIIGSTFKGIVGANTFFGK